MKKIRNHLFSAALSAVLLAGCGGKEEPLPTPKASNVAKPLKERTVKEQIERIDQAATDIINIADAKSDLTSQQRDRILMSLFFDYMEDPPKTGETSPDKYYERLCTSSAKALCDGVFPENYKTVFFKAVLEKVEASLQALKDQIPNANLKETRAALLSKEPSLFAEALSAIKISKGDRASYTFVDHPVNLPDRNSAVNTKIGLDDKGNVLVVVSGEKATSFSIPTGPAPAQPPEFKKLVNSLTDLRLRWEDFAKKEAEAKQEGKVAPGAPGYEVDGYIELQFSPGAPGWAVAWAIKACEEAGYANPVLIVRSTGDVARLGMLPFPQNREFKDVLGEPIKVKAGGETSKPSKELNKDLLAKLWPEDGATVQDIAKALDKLGGCQDNPCGFFQNILTVERWKSDD